MIYPSKQRHTSATLLLYGGVNVRQVQERLGHGNLKTTNIYLHCIAEADEEAAKTIYYSTHDVRFIRRVREAFESKYEAYSSKKPPSSIDILPLNEEKKLLQTIRVHGLMLIMAFFSYTENLSIFSLCMMLDLGQRHLRDLECLR
ncbi:MAG: tyrosine-type recombinase/integrase [Oscillospiraceae bacterium]|nr:tyrosine-type recombinase/integrase [Oscillospiraceae bacterium]